MMDRAGSSANLLFEVQGDDPGYITKGHFFIAQRALHQESEALGERLDQLVADLRQSEARNRDYIDAKFTTQMEELRNMIVRCPSSSSSSSRRRHSTAAQAGNLRTTPFTMQVLHELEYLGVLILKIAKLKKILSMAMAYKTESEHVKGRDNKRKKKWSKSKYLRKCNIKNLKMMTPSVKHKHSKHNAHSASPLEPLKSATAKCENKRKLFVGRSKKKPRIAKNNKKGATKRLFLAPLHDTNDTKWTKCFKTLSHAKSDILRNEYSRTFHHGKSDINNATMMKNFATASSSSPCPSSSEAMIPKDTSHGP